MAFNSNRSLSAKPMPSVVLLAGYLLAFCLLTGSIAFWVMQMLAPVAPAAASGVVAEKTSSLDLAGASLLFGTVNTQKPGSSAPVVTSSNIHIVGLMASNGRRGSAILSVDNKPGQAFAQGDLITPDTRLLEVKRASIVIEKNGERSNVTAPVRPSLAALQAKTLNQTALSTGASSAATTALPPSSIARPIGASSGASPSANGSPIAPIQPPPAFSPSATINPPPTVQPITPAQGILNQPNAPSIPASLPVQPQSSISIDSPNALPAGFSSAGRQKRGNGPAS